MVIKGFHQYYLIYQKRTSKIYSSCFIETTAKLSGKLKDISDIFFANFFFIGIKNPVSVANRLLCEGQKGKLSAGRIPPW